MLCVCRSKLLHKHCLQFLLGVKMALRETENKAYAKFGVTNKEHYGVLWYFLEWSIKMVTSACNKRRGPRIEPCGTRLPGHLRLESTPKTECDT